MEKINLECKNICFHYSGGKGIQNITLNPEEGKLYALLGRSGSGKSTLLKLLAAILEPDSGEITLNGTNLKKLSPKNRAKSISYMPQSFIPEFAYSCKEFISFGVIEKNFFSIDKSAENEILQLVKRLNASSLIDKKITEISGGEFQKILLAQTIASGGKLLLLDEPISHQDIASQSAILQELSHMSKNDGYTIIAAIHEIGMALNYCDRFIFMNSGSAELLNSIQEVVKSDICKRSYQLDFEFIKYDGNGTGIALKNL